MTSRSFAVAACAAVSVASAASAAVVSFTNQMLWQMYSTGQGSQVATENFNSYSGSYAAGVSGTSVGVNWSVNSTGGLTAFNGQLQTASSGAMTFTFQPGLKGVAANVYATDVSFETVPSIIQVTLSDGSAYIGYSSSQSDFVGFYSTGASITSMTVTSAALNSGQVVYPTIDNLFLSAPVPAPGALALLGLAGVRRRARR